MKKIIFILFASLTHVCAFMLGTTFNSNQTSNQTSNKKELTLSCLKGMTLVVDALEESVRTGMPVRNVADKCEGDL